VTYLVAKKKQKKRDPAFSAAGGKARAEKLAQERRIEIAKEGNAAWIRNTTAKQRSAAASKAAKERWRLWREKKNLADEQS
jgi:hypothetical protein